MKNSTSNVPMYVFVSKRAIVDDLRNNCATIIPFKPIWRQKWLPRWPPKSKFVIYLPINGLKVYLKRLFRLDLVKRPITDLYILYIIGWETFFFVSQNGTQNGRQDGRHYNKMYYFVNNRGKSPLQKGQCMFLSVKEQLLMIWGTAVKPLFHSSQYGAKNCF